MTPPVTQTEDVPCPLCGVDSKKVVASQRDFVHRVDTETRWHLRECGFCRHYYLSPRPTKESISSYYSADYSYHNINRAKRCARHLLRRVVQYAYLPDVSSYGFSYYPRGSGALRALGCMLVPLLANRGLSGVSAVWMTPVSYGLAIRPGMRFLDVGCGTGWDAHLTMPVLGLRGLARRGVECVGIERSAACRARLAKDGIRAYACVSECLHACEKPFNLIRLNWCIEHVHDPLELFHRLRGLSDENTKIIVTLPNYDGVAYTLSPECIEVPLHLHYFTVASLRKLCAKTGYRVERMHTFSTPGVLAYAIGLREGKTPDHVLATQRRRIVALINDAIRKDAGDEIFCLMSPSPSSQGPGDSLGLSADASIPVAVSRLLHS